MNEDNDLQYREAMERARDMCIVLGPNWSPQVAQDVSGAYVASAVQNSCRVSELNWGLDRADDHFVAVFQYQYAGDYICTMGTVECKAVTPLDAAYSLRRMMRELHGRIDHAAHYLSVTTVLCSHCNRYPADLPNELCDTCNYNQQKG